jgi:CheY-like chemotaxis protein
MSYRALLFCADEKTVRAVNQILHELEFSVEACSEPFSAVKQLTATHFDALLVDCENEQNATLLFKSARNSEFNHASLSVGLVEGQAAIAKAFRIGANLILSKPINLEQAKSTLRVARGLLRKAEAAKAMAQPTPEPALQAAPELALQTALESATPDVTEADSAPAESAPSPAPIALSAAASVGGIEIEEKEPAPKLGAAEAALLESLPEPIVPALGENTTRLLAAESASAQVATPSQDPVPAPAASQSFSVTDNKVEPESAATPEPAKESAPSVAASPSSAAGAATAPAKETPKQAAEPPA